MNEQTIKEALRQIIDRTSGQDVIESGLVSGIFYRDGKAGFLITIDPKDKEEKAYLRDACEQAVLALPGITKVTAVLTAQNSDPIPPSPQSGYTQPRERAQWNLTPLEHIGRVIAIASGKGGVGKSTTTVNLARALHAAGKRVGILDADIYGPSIPRLLGLSGQPEIVDGKMQPFIAAGIKAMSVGFIMGDSAAILRGPMISKTLTQMLRMTRWGSAQEPLDYLLVDMPPGTGDVHISIAQQVPLHGAIIVTTPQQVAVIDAMKAALTFQKLGVKILGVIENMSGELFGSGGGKQLASDIAASFLGTIQADSAIREAADAGAAYQGRHTDTYKDIITHLF
ncbi:MAG: Mrp/NBP35 family ATP-binding protein [Rickettsiales bacterium]|nr:Mrp/NBP35 family ATP-binding protein [Rickettsiales bacterium]